jgi:hypothetical protein
MTPQVNLNWTERAPQAPSNTTPAPAPTTGRTETSAPCEPTFAERRGLAMPWPAISGAEPWIGSKREGWHRSGSRLADGAMPMEPETAAVISERMSPNRFEPTMTSKSRGRSTNCATRR